MSTAFRFDTIYFDTIYFDTIFRSAALPKGVNAFKNSIRFPLGTIYFVAVFLSE